MEACLFRDHHDVITKHGFSVFGLSNDSSAANRSFWEKHRFPFILLSDPLSSLISAIGLQKFQFGTTPGIFIIDRTGKVLEATPCRPTESLDIVKRVIGALPASVAAAPTAQEAAATRAKSADETISANTSLDEPRDRKGSEGGARPVTTTSAAAGLTEEDFNIMAGILVRITEYRSAYDGRDISEAFQQLPDRQAIPEYFAIVRQPIALSTIRQKIIKKAYATFKDFVRDFTFIFHNAKVFSNESSSQVYKDAIILQELFKTQLEKLVDVNAVSADDAKLPDLGDMLEVEDPTPSKSDDELPGTVEHPIQVQSSSAAIGASIGTEASRQPESTSAKLSADDIDVDEQGRMSGWLRTSVIHLLAVVPLSEGELRRKLAMQETYDGSDLQLALKQILKEVALVWSHGPPAENRLKWHLKPDIYRELDIWRFSYSDAEERKRAIDNVTKQYRQLDMGPDEPEWTKLLPEAERAPIQFLSKRDTAASARAQNLSFIEIQDDEIIALAGAYGEDFRKLSPTNQGWKRFEIRIRSSREEAFTLRVILPATYPTTKPELALHDYFGVGEETRQRVMKMLDTQLELTRLIENEQPMIMDIVNACAITLGNAVQDKAAGKRPVDAVSEGRRTGMGSFVFRWEHPASEVYVTGTFDNWSKNEKLVRIGDIFEKRVTLPLEKTYYKFVVNGYWTTNHTAPQELDASGNLNNYLTAEMIAAGGWNSPTIVQALPSDESKNYGRGHTGNLVDSSPPRPTEQSTQDNETYSREDMLSIDRAQPTVTIDRDSNLYSVIIRNSPISMRKDDWEQRMRSHDIDFVAVEVLPSKISEELGLGSNAAILRFTSHESAVQAEMHFNQLDISQMTVEVIHGWTMSKLAASKQLEHSIQRGKAETEKHKNTDEDRDDSVGEIRSVGVNLNKSKPIRQTAMIGDLIQEFSLIKDTTNAKFPHGFMSPLEKRIQGVLVGTEQLPGYNDAAVKRTFAEAYTAFTEQGFRRRMDKERRVEDLVLIFYSNATKALQKGKGAVDDSWKPLVDRHVALFVKLIGSTLKDHGNDKDRPELMSRLAILESKLLTNDQDLLTASGDGAGGNSATVMEEERQWLKDATEARRLLSLSSRISPNEPRPPGEQRSLVSRDATTDVEEDGHKNDHSLHEAEGAPGAQETQRYITPERNSVIKSFSSFTMQNQLPFDLTPIIIEDQKIDVIKLFITVRDLGGYDVVTVQNRWSAVADALLFNVTIFLSACQQLQSQYGRRLLGFEKWLSDDSEGKHGDKISRTRRYSEILTGSQSQQSSNPAAPSSPEETELSESQPRPPNFDGRPLEGQISATTTLPGGTTSNPRALLARQDAMRNFWNVLVMPTNDEALTQCIGSTHEGTRCRYSFSKQVSQEIHRLINKIAQLQAELDPSEVSVLLPYLQNLARLWLCNNHHQEQVSDLVNQWMESIDVGQLESMQRDIVSVINGAGSTIEHAPAKQ